MKRTSSQRSIVLGAGLATALVVAILVLTGGQKPAPAPLPAPAGEAPLPMLDAVNKASQATPPTAQTPDANAAKPLKTEADKPSEPVLNH